MGLFECVLDSGINIIEDDYCLCSSFGSTDISVYNQIDYGSSFINLYAYTLTSYSNMVLLSTKNFNKYMSENNYGSMQLMFGINKSSTICCLLFKNGEIIQDTVTSAISTSSSSDAYSYELTPNEYDADYILIIFSHANASTTFEASILFSSKSSSDDTDTTVEV